MHKIDKGELTDNKTLNVRNLQYERKTHGTLSSKNLH